MRYSKLLNTILCISIYLTIISSECIKWGKTFPGIQSENVRRDCKTKTGYPICCVATDDAISDTDPSDQNELDYYRLRAVGDSSKKKRLRLRHQHHCEIVKEYIPSEFELYNLNQSYYIQDFWPAERLAKFKEIIFSDYMMESSEKWLERVKERNTFYQNKDWAEAIPSNDVDNKYLSRFHILRVCSQHPSSSSSNPNASKVVVEEWDEFIEPITVHMRHPGSLGDCRTLNIEEQSKFKNIKKGLVNVDHILLANALDIQKKVDNSESGHRYPPNHYLLDAGI